MAEPAATTEPEVHGAAPEKGADAKGDAALKRHVEQRTLVFPDLRILYVPVPKAGCTAIMWALARAAGLDETGFFKSYYREVTRSLTIHDLSHWPDEYLFAKLGEEERKKILSSEEWLRFTVVRHPFRRLWSAWQSKVLLAEPQFIEKFSDEPWFPPSIESGEGVLKMFEQFVSALEGDRRLVNADVHWAPQTILISQDRLPYTHVGRVERLGETIERVTEHLSAIEGAPALPEIPRANPSPLGYTDELFDAASIELLGELFADDLREFDYEPPTGDALGSPPPPSWIETVDSVAPVLQSLRDRNQRVGDLQQLFKTRREQMNDRIGKQRTRIETQKNKIEDQQQKLRQQRSLRADEQRRNKRLQERLRVTTNRLERIEKSASWRYTAPLRRLGDFGRKLKSRLRP